MTESHRPTAAERMSRGRFLALAGGTALAATGLRAGSALARARIASVPTLTKGGTVNIWTWPEYWAPSNLSGFKKATGTTVNIASYTSSDEMYSKLTTAAGAQYDIAIPDCGWLPVMAQKGVLQKIDHSRVAYNRISKQFLGYPEDPHNEYSVPKDYASTGVVYDPGATGGKIVTWMDYFDAMKKPGASGKVDWPAEPAEIFGIAFWAMGGGKDWNTATEADLKQAYDFCLGYVKHVHAFNDFETSAVANGSVVAAAMTNANARLAMLQNKKLKWVIPQPKSELILDNYTIPAHAPDVNQAYSFINYMLEPAHQVADCTYLGYPLLLPGIKSKMPKNTKLEDIIFTDPKDFARLQPLDVRPSVQGYAEQLFSQLQAAA
jgi:spermidine/putrescine transport system substrate-binding protein